MMYGKVLTGMNLVGDVGHESDVTSTLDSNSDLSLMLSAGAGDSSGKDLASFGGALFKSLGVLVVYVFDAVSAEYANLFSLASVLTLHSLLRSSIGSFSCGSSGFFRNNNFSLFGIHCYISLLLNFHDSRLEGEFVVV